MRGLQITLSWQNIIGLAGGIAALVALFTYLFRGYDFVKRQKEQDAIIKSIQAEQIVLTNGILACLKGLHEQGVNDAVTTAISDIEKHLNAKAHGG